MKKLVLVFIIFSIYSGHLVSQNMLAETYNLMPWPQEINENSASFNIDEQLTIHISGEDAKQRVHNNAVQFLRRLANRTGIFIDAGFPIENKNASLAVIKDSIEEAGSLASFRLEKYLGFLSTISTVAPLLGLFGTIIGMVQLFYGIASTGEYTLNTIAGGIYTKMITSATGLIIGLIAYVGYNFLSTLIDKTANKMEVASSEFIDILQEPTR